jgi:hypothetical protein
MRGGGYLQRAVLDLFHDEGIKVLVGTDVLRVDGISGTHVNLQVGAGTASAP